MPVLVSTDKYKLLTPDPAFAVVAHGYNDAIEVLIVARDCEPRKFYVTARMAEVTSYFEYYFEDIDTPELATNACCILARDYCIRDAQFQLIEQVTRYGLQLN